MLEPSLLQWLEFLSMFSFLMVTCSQVFSWVLFLRLSLFLLLFSCSGCSFAAWFGIVTSSFLDPCSLVFFGFQATWDFLSCYFIFFLFGPLCCYLGSLVFRVTQKSFFILLEVYYQCLKWARCFFLLSFISYCACFMCGRWKIPEAIRLVLFSLALFPFF